MGYRPLRMPAMACDTMPDPAFPMHHELVVTAFLCFVWALEKALSQGAIADRAESALDGACVGGSFLFVALDAPALK